MNLREISEQTSLVLASKAGTLAWFCIILAMLLSASCGGGDGDRDALFISASEGSCVQVSINGKVELREVDAAGNVTDQRCLTDDDVDNSDNSISE